MGELILIIYYSETVEFVSRNSFFILTTNRGVWYFTSLEGK